MVQTREMKMARKEELRIKAKKAEEEADQKSKREQLQREMAYQRLVRDELDTTWRQTLLKIQEPVFKQEVAIMRQRFERTLDKKDFYITQILNLMDIADDQSRRSFCSFFETIHTMIDNFVDNFEEKARENEIKTTELLKTRGDNSPGLRKFLEAESHLQVVMYHSQTTAESLRWAARGDMLTALNEDKAEYGSLHDRLSSLLHNYYTKIWDEYTSVFSTYLAKTALFVRESRKLRKRENEMADIIAAQAKKLAENDSVVARLRSELNSYDSGDYQRAFREKRDCYRAFNVTMRKKTMAGCAKDEKQLDILLQEADKAIQWLEAARNKAEKILRVAALCRRHETLREKVLPFGSSMPESSNDTKIHLREMTSKKLGRRLVTTASPSNKPELINPAFVDDTILETCGLSRLWLRVSNAEMTKRALFREKMLLQKENKAMLHELQKYTKKFNKNCSCKVTKIPTLKPILKP